MSNVNVEELKKDIEIYKKLLLTDSADIDDDKKLMDLAVDIGTEVLDIINQNSDRYKPYLLINEWSDIIKERKILLLCPASFGETFIFMPKTCFFKSFIVPNGNRNDSSVLDLGVFRDVHVFKVKECNYSVGTDETVKQKGEVFDLDIVDAKIAYIMRETNKKLQNYEGLYLDNEVSKSKYETLWDSYKTVKKKYIHENKQEIQLQKQLENVKPKVEWGNPPKQYYGITIIGWILSLLFFIFWILNFRLGGE